MNSSKKQAVVKVIGKPYFIQIQVWLNAFFKFILAWMTQVITTVFKTEPTFFEVQPKSAEAAELRQTHLGEIIEVLIAVDGRDYNLHHKTH